MNQSQKLIVSATSTALICLTLLHNPMSGYIKNTPINVGEFDSYGKVKSFERFVQEQNCIIGKSVDISSKEYYCDRESGKLVKELGFFDIKTKDPVQKWFSSMRNFLSVFFGISILGIILLFAFATKKEEVI